MSGPQYQCCYIPGLSIPCTCGLPFRSPHSTHKVTRLSACQKNEKRGHVSLRMPVHPMICTELAILATAGRNDVFAAQA